MKILIRAMIYSFLFFLVKFFSLLVYELYSCNFEFIKSKITKTKISQSSCFEVESCLPAVPCWNCLKYIKFYFECSKWKSQMTAGFFMGNCKLLITNFMKCFKFSLLNSQIPLPWFCSSPPIKNNLPSQKTASFIMPPFYCILQEASRPPLPSHTYN